MWVKWAEGGGPGHGNEKPAGLVEQSRFSARAKSDKCMEDDGKL